MSKLAAFENINKKYAITGLHPSEVQQQPPTRFQAQSNIPNAPLRTSQTVLRRSRVVSNLPNGQVVQQVVQQIHEIPVMSRGPVVTTIQRTQHIPKDVQHWRDPAPIVDDRASHTMMSRSRRGYIPDDSRRNKSSRYCNWTCCLWAFVILLLLAAIGFGLMKVFGGMFGPKRRGGGEAGQGTSGQTQEWKEGNQVGGGGVTGGTDGCSPTFFRFNGECIKCPPSSNWNGTNCIVKRTVRIGQNTEGSTITQHPSLNREAEEAWRVAMNPGSDTPQIMPPKPQGPQNIPKAQWPTFPNSSHLNSSVSKH